MKSIFIFLAIVLFPETFAIYPKLSSFPETDSLSNAIGTPCSTNSSNVWLDLYFLIDVSGQMLEADIAKLSGILAIMFESLTIGQTRKQSTRVGIITYATNVTVRLNLTACDSADTLLDVVFQLRNYRLPNDDGTNFKFGLYTVLNLTKTEQSYRRTAIVIIAAGYDPDTAENAGQLVEIIKEDGIPILTIDFGSSSDANLKFANLSSPGYAYTSTDPQLIDKMLFAFTQINCVCPPGMYQFKTYDNVFKNFTVFADCLFSSDGALVDPIFAEQICNANTGAVLASVTSEQKLEFIVGNVVKETIPNITQFTVGAHLVNDQWLWYGYNGTVYPVGAYPEIPTNSLGTFGYFNHSSGWEFQTQNPTHNPKPYICQSKACDADTLACMFSENIDPPQIIVEKNCSTNSSNAWLDLYFVIEVSEAMLGTNLLRISGVLLTLFEGLTIGQTPKHSTRVGIITYASTATVRLNLTACDNFNTLTNTAFQLQNYRLPNDSGTNIKSGLETVSELKQKEQSYRPTAVVIIAASYNPDSPEDPTWIADDLKQSGTTILTITYESSGALNTRLGNLATPGYAYDDNDPQLFVELLLAFTQINCFCPPNTYQLKLFNDESDDFTVFPDCFYSYDVLLDPPYAEKFCENFGGILASVTSAPKLDFIIDVVVAKTMPKSKQFTVGAHLVNAQWVWYGYNGTTYPVGDYPRIPVNESGSYIYFNNTFGFNWDIHRQNGTRNPKPFVCQSKACDADFLCDLTAHSFKKR